MLTLHLPPIKCSKRFHLELYGKLTELPCTVNFFIDGLSYKLKMHPMKPELQDMEISGVKLKAEALVSLEELEKGIEGIPELQEDTGVVSIFPHPNRVMVDLSRVAYAVDVGFFDENGKLAEVKTIEPNSKEPCFSSSDEIQFLLQMRGNWFADKKVNSGETLMYVAKTPIWMVYDMMKLLPKENFVDADTADKA